MRAAILRAAGDASVVELEDPVCGSKDVIIKTVRSGICGSDVTAYTKGNQYMNIDVDGEFGHETAGYITEVGNEITDLKVGMRVFPQPIAILPLGKSNMLGGFSEYIHVPNAQIGYNIFILPDNISYDEGALIEPFAVGTRGKNVPGAKPGDHVVVYGVGTIGISCISGLVAQGIKPVAVARNNKKRELLEKIGAIVCNINEVDLFEFLKKTFGETKHRLGYPAIDVDIVVDCAGGTNIIGDFLQMRKPKSRLSIVGVSSEPVPVLLRMIMSAEVIVQGSCAYETEDIIEVIDNLASGKTHMKEIITHHYKLDEINEAIKMAGDREHAIKVVIDME